MKILVVDGDRLFARLVRTKLEKWGHTVVVEGNGAAAYERISKEPFRVVILDWDPPGMSGPELCARIRKIKRARYTYIIFYTAKDDKDSVMACLEAGADDYLTKPLNTVELRLRIRAGKRMLNLEDELREGPGNDTATGVVNGASFREFFRVVLAETRRSGSSGTLLYVRLQNYRQAFADHGYNPAEALMLELAHLLTRVSRTSDLVARIDDETFCILLQHTYWDKCRPVADKTLSQAQGISVVLDGATLHPELEITAVNFPQDEQDYEQILDHADRLTYDANAAQAQAATGAPADQDRNARPAG